MTAVSSMLAPDEVHVWLAWPDTIGDSAPLAEYATLLDADERERWQRFRFAKHRRQFLIAHALVRTTLSRYAPLAPQAWRFRKNRYGRPEIDNEALGPPLRFNLSHTEGLIACAVVLERDVGIDVETTARNAHTLAIAERFFSADECRELRALAPPAQYDRFFDYWTLKEAYIKARGMGLALPIGQFSFHLAADTSIGISFSDEIQDDPARWQFWLLRPSLHHRLAVCVAKRAQAQPQDRLLVIPAQQTASWSP
jgi:4'-phosphopantetheinyl transferase